MWAKAAKCIEKDLIRRFVLTTSAVEVTVAPSGMVRLDAVAELTAADRNTGLDASVAIVNDHSSTTPTSVGTVSATDSVQTPLGSSPTNAASASCGTSADATTPAT